jgi:hypothetical protein
MPRYSIWIENDNEAIKLIEMTSAWKAKRDAFWLCRVGYNARVIEGGY